MNSVPVNPFDLPGEEDHEQPLSPLVYPEHEEHYVDVDGIGCSFQQFKDCFSGNGKPLENGRLFVVCGLERSGKTSLVNRCAHWLRTEHPDVVVCDLRASGTATMSVEHRMKAAAALVALRVRVDNLIAPHLMEFLKECANSPGDVYPLLSAALNVRLVLLLPPCTDAEGEIAAYARHVNARLLFMTESVYEDQLKRELRIIHDNSGRAPVVLHLGPLSVEDSVVFAQARLGKCPEGRRFPKMSADDIRETAAKRQPIGYLQWLLFWVYEERLRADKRYTSVDSVTYHDVIDWHYRTMVVGGRGFNGWG